MSAPAPFRSAIYRGRVMHQRLRPLKHRLSYRMFSLLLDIDELPALHAGLRWFSVGRFNLFSFRPSDHGDGTATDGAGLRRHIEARLAEAGLPAGGAIRLLTLPRLFGYAFNPLSVWFCDGPEGGLQALVYEVNNTFGQRHSYLIPVHPAQRQAAWVTQRCDKQLYVSPFMGMAMHYRFRVAPPGETLSIGVSVHHDSVRDVEAGRAAHAQIDEAPGDGGAPRTEGGASAASDPEVGACALHAQLDASRQPLGDPALLKLLISHPLLTVKVMVGIHWEALRLWIKGARLHERPAAPEHPLTIVRSGEPT